MVNLGNLDIEQLKVPLGFIKLVQIPLALITYAALHGWKFDLNVYCKLENGTMTSKHSYETTSYSLAGISYKNCSDTPTNLFPESFGGSSGLVGFVCIFSIIYCLIMLFIYLYRWDAYANDDRLPRLDTGMTILLSFLWFFSFWIWWRYSSALEAMTTEENVKKLSDDHKFCTAPDCQIRPYAMYAPVTVSLLAAIGNIILYSYNIWIVYKETVWFHQRQMNQQPHTVEPTITLA
uniref:MARVEL domain-containing protein n=1 Tax=Panagrolaimus superbus TaxID=310955 RepID=A0A914YS92_9BILA